MKLSVIIPCLNAAGTIAAQLDALSRQRWDEAWEVIVCDNGSTDGTVAIARGYSDRLPSLQIIDASAKRGAAYARNIGVLAARGENLAFCDADDEVGEGWLAAMGNAVARHPAVACRMDTTKLNPLWVQDMYGPHPQREGLQRAWYPPYWHHAAGGTLAVRREVHAAVGGFDEQLSQVEDMDFCFRVQRAGIPLTFVPDTVVHYRLRSIRREIFRQGRLWAMHQGLLYKRYRPAGTREYGRWVGYARSWLELLLRLPAIRSTSQWAHWQWRANWEIGRLQGSLKYGVPPV